MALLKFLWEVIAPFFHEETFLDFNTCLVEESFDVSWAWIYRVKRLNCAVGKASGFSAEQGSGLRDVLRSFDCTHIHSADTVSHLVFLETGFACLIAVILSGGAD